MMHPRWLALPLAALTGCATAAPTRLLSTDLHMGSLDQRTSFELDDRGSARATERDAPDDTHARADRRAADTEKKQRIRKLLYWTGIGAFGFGAVGTVGFGVGGRIVQAQLKNGYEDSDLTRDREDQLTTTGQVMNGLAIGSAVVGLLGIAIAATAYGIDHARCGELRPRRKQCAEDAKGSGSTTQGTSDSGGVTPDEAAAEVDASEAGETTSPTQPSETAPSKIGPSEASPGTSPSTPTTSNPSPGAKHPGPGGPSSTPPPAPGSAPG